MLVRIDGEGAIALGTPAGADAPPAVGDVLTRWNLDVTSRLASATTTYITKSVITGIDLSQKSVVRRKQTIGLSDEHSETILLDHPRPGYYTRPRGEAPDSTGRLIRFTEYTALSIPGTGVFAVVLPGIKVFEIAIAVP